jgi:hypothetical protein
MYWTQPPHREKPVKLEDLLIKPEDLPGQWVLEEDPFSQDDYSWDKFHEENWGYSMNNIQVTEFIHNRIIRNWNVPVAEFRYKYIYKDAYDVFGVDSEFHRIIEVNNLDKIGNQNDVICFESIGANKTGCKLFFRFDEYVVKLNFGVIGSDISTEALEGKINYYSNLAYLKFVKAGLVGGD